MRGQAVRGRWGYGRCKGKGNGRIRKCLITVQLPFSIDILQLHFSPLSFYNGISQCKFAMAFSTCIFQWYLPLVFSIIIFDIHYEGKFSNQRIFLCGRGKQQRVGMQHIKDGSGKGKAQEASSRGGASRPEGKTTTSEGKFKRKPAQATGGRELLGSAGKGQGVRAIFKLHFTTTFSNVVFPRPSPTRFSNTLLECY